MANVPLCVCDNHKVNAFPFIKRRYIRDNEHGHEFVFHPNRKLFIYKFTHFYRFCIEKFFIEKKKQVFLPFIYFR